jgi:hypothetical protein
MGTCLRVNAHRRARPAKNLNDSALHRADTPHLRRHWEYRVAQYSPRSFAGKRRIEIRFDVRHCSSCLSHFTAHCPLPFVPCACARVSPPSTSAPATTHPNAAIIDVFTPFPSPSRIASINSRGISYQDFTGLPIMRGIV